MSRADDNSDNLVERATGGDKDALESLVASIQDRVYRLALRMLYHPADAEDAAQEILIKIVTHLGTFRGESAFATWALRIAANHLLTTRRRRAERKEISFDYCESQITDSSVEPDLPALSVTRLEQEVLVQEVRLHCLQGLLLCLERPYRLAFILGDIFALPSDEAADVLEITPEAFRMRLSRARSGLLAFTRRNCGVINPQSRCQCAREARSALKTGWPRLEKQLFTGHPTRDEVERAATELAGDLDEIGQLKRLFNDHPAYAAPESLMRAIGRQVGLRAD